MFLDVWVTKFLRTPPKKYKVLDAIATNGDTVAMVKHKTHWNTTFIRRLESQ